MRSPATPGTNACWVTRGQRSHRRPWATRSTRATSTSRSIATAATPTRPWRLPSSAARRRHLSTSSSVACAASSARNCAAIATSARRWWRCGRRRYRRARRLPSGGPASGEKMCNLYSMTMNAGRDPAPVWRRRRPRSHRQSSVDAWHLSQLPSADRPHRRRRLRARHGALGHAIVARGSDEGDAAAGGEAEGQGHAGGRGQPFRPGPRLDISR